MANFGTSWAEPGYVPNLDMERANKESITAMYKRLFQPDEEVTLKVTEIAMGQNHMLAIGFDRLSMVNDDKDSLMRYAIHVLEPLR